MTARKSLLQRLGGWSALVLAHMLMSASALATDGGTSLPAYVPGEKVSGVVRVWGTPQMKEVLESWQQEFRRHHPQVWFTNTLKGSASAQFSLHMGQADVAFSGRKLYPYEYYGIHRRSQMLTAEIEVATGSHREPGKSTALAVFVHEDNPIVSLSVEQLDGIFGAERSGGWQGMEWVTAVARGPEGNIRTWGQLGLPGEWTAAAIRPYGPPALFPGGVSFFQSRVHGGADTRNEALLEFFDREEMMRALSRDRNGIAYAALGHQVPGTRAVAISEAGGDAVLPDARTVVSRTYPLWRPVYAYYAPDTPVGDPAEPRTSPVIAEFLRFVLSKQGQRLVKPASGYLPLGGDVARRQIEKL